MSFSLQIVVFLILGSFADFGNWRSSILIVQSLIGIAVGFAWLGVYTPEQWKLAIGVNIVGLISFQTSIAYFFAAFPALARNTPGLRKKAEELNNGVIDREEYDQADSMERNHISNVSLWIAGIGGMVVIAIMMGLLHGVDATASVEKNSWGLSLIIGFGSAVWLVFALPWFVLEKRRPGQPIPPGMNIFTAGAWQVYRAATQIGKLKQSLAYLIGIPSLSRVVCFMTDQDDRLLHPWRVLGDVGLRCWDASNGSRRVRHYNPVEAHYGSIRGSHHRFVGVHQVPENIQPLHQDHALRRGCLYHHYEPLGYNWDLDRRRWVPQHLGILDIRLLVRVLREPLV